MATLSVRAWAENSTQTHITAGRHSILIDEPTLFGGADTAPSPVEMLLASLAGALNAIGQYVAGELGFTLHRLDIAIDGDCDGARFFGKSEDCRAGFQDIRVALTVDADIDAATLTRWEEQVRLRCPVLDNLISPAPVAVEVTHTTQKEHSV